MQRIKKLKKTRFYFYNQDIYRGTKRAFVFPAGSTVGIAVWGFGGFFGLRYSLEQVINSNSFTLTSKKKAEKQLGEKINVDEVRGYLKRAHL